jgi:hypothetical protein
MSPMTGRGAATCGVHRFADETPGVGCPWCRINRLTAEVADLRTQLGRPSQLGPDSDADVATVETHRDGRTYLRTLNEQGGFTYTLVDDDQPSSSEPTPSG